MFCMILRGPRDLARTQRDILFPEKRIPVFFHALIGKRERVSFPSVAGGHCGNPLENPRESPGKSKGSCWPRLRIFQFLLHTLIRGGHVSWFCDSYYTYLSEGGHVSGLSNSYYTHLSVEGMSHNPRILTTHTHPLRAYLTILQFSLQTFIRGGHVSQFQIRTAHTYLRRARLRTSQFLLNTFIWMGSGDSMLVSQMPHMFPILVTHTYPRSMALINESIALIWKHISIWTDPFIIIYITWMDKYIVATELKYIQCISWSRITQSTECI